MSDHALEVIKQVGSIHFEGNIIPHEWYKHLRYNDGKPNAIAAIILSEIVYWYRPGVEKDERTGRVLRYYKRFKDDKLQRSYGSFAEQFGFTKRQVRSAIDFLKDKGLITTELRIVPVKGGMPMSNVLYIEVVPEAIRRICLPCDIHVRVYDTERNPCDIHVTPSDTVSQTYTETTTETTYKEGGSAPATQDAPPQSEQPNDTDNRHDRKQSRLPATPHQAILDAYANQLGYKLPNAGKEVKAAKWLADNGYTPDQVVACYQHVKADKFYFDKHLSLTVIQQQIGAYLSKPTTTANRPKLSKEEQDARLLASRIGISIEEARREVQRQAVTV